jgi:cholesterol transport system auxiliary component
MRQTRPLTLLAILPLLTLAGCISLGPKTPAELLRLTPVQTAPADTGEAVAAGRAVTVAYPLAPMELSAVRVPVRSGQTTLAYVKDATWADTPSHLFRDLLAETIRARTDRPVLDPRDYHLAPGLRLTGRIQEFGLDSGSMQVTMVYDATLERASGGVATRRFTASAPAGAATSSGVSPALNTVANQVAQQVADWLGR